MAGVAGPMLRQDKVRGARFLLGMLVGGLLASSALTLVIAEVGRLLSVFSETDRSVVAGGIVVGLGVADWTNHTPHVWRQVPQALVRRYSPGRLGLVWGFDLSLLVTTQKSTSLIWAALAGVLLVDSPATVPVVFGATVAGVLAVTSRSVWWYFSGPSWSGDREKSWFSQMRQLTGGLLVIAGIGVALGGAGRCQVVGAPEAPIRRPLNASVGLRQLRVSRGRPLSSSATASSSAWE